MKRVTTLLLVFGLLAVAQRLAMGAQATSPTCYPSELNYQCMLQVCNNIALHWSLGGPPPDNTTSPCHFTASHGQTGALNASSDTLHVALHSFLPGASLTSSVSQSSHGKVHHAGWVGIALPVEAGEMVPADALVASMGAGDTAQPAVTAYHLKGFSTSSNPVDPTISISGVAGASLPLSRRLLCFSRPVSARGAAGVKLRLTGQDLNFAASSQPSWGIHTIHCHVRVSFLAQRLPTNSSVVVGGNVPSTETHSTWAAELHGALMVAAWAVLVPLGMLMPRYRLLLASTSSAASLSTSIHPASGKLWFYSHVGLQLSAALLTLVSLFLIIDVHGLEIMEWQGLMRAHGGVGITLVLVLTFHLILAASRPHPGTSRRPFWELLHTNTGRCLLLLGFTNLMIGPKVYSHMSAHSSMSSSVTARFYAAALTCLALLALLALLAEWRLRSLRRQLGSWGPPGSMQPGAGQGLSPGLSEMVEYSQPQGLAAGGTSLLHGYESSSAAAPDPYLQPACNPHNDDSGRKSSPHAVSGGQWPSRVGDIGRAAGQEAAVGKVQAAGQLGVAVSQLATKSERGQAQGVVTPAQLADIRLPRPLPASPSRAPLQALETTTLPGAGNRGMAPLAGSGQAVGVEGSVEQALAKGGWPEAAASSSRQSAYSAETAPSLQAWAGSRGGGGATASLQRSELPVPATQHVSSVDGQVTSVAGTAHEPLLVPVAWIEPGGDARPPTAKLVMLDASQAGVGK
ncbi:hypothetical protein QJQ45_024769 [Haematococcus lacustris]|nr:hypothetical protein QJQ45_024769 [Haematococcus lacustris]